MHTTWLTLSARFAPVIIGLLGLQGCSNSAAGPTLLIEVTATVEITDINTLHVQLSNPAMTSDPVVIQLEDAPAHIPPSRTFALHLPQRGTFDIQIDAKNMNDERVAWGKNSITIEKNQRADRLIALEPVFERHDGGMTTPDFGIDLGIPDLANPPDQATPDLLPPIPPSCQGLLTNCGPSQNENCCAHELVPSGAFLRSYDETVFSDPAYPATVSSFYLDRFEVTASRFRTFIDQGPGTATNPPASGAGAHPQIPGSGWDSTWNGNLPQDQETFRNLLLCDPLHATFLKDTEAINCVSWYEAFAFCAWDGGRLPTEAEWNDAAQGGNEQRPYPWGNAPLTTLQAVYCNTTCQDIEPVGMRSPLGDGKWRHADLAGNVWEWVLDGYGTYPLPCSNCANLDTKSFRSFRGGSFSAPSTSSLLRAGGRDGGDPTHRDNSSGFRCARDL